MVNYSMEDLKKFEGIDVRVPLNYKGYLNKIYGDYMKLPPESERKSHLPLLISFTNGVNRTHEN